MKSAFALVGLLLCAYIAEVKAQDIEVGPSNTPAISSFTLTPPQTVASPADGQCWYDSTIEAMKCYFNGVAGVVPSVIFSQTADKVVANTTTATSIIGTGVGTATLPANFCQVGKTVRFTISGFYSSAALLPSLTTQAKLGSVSLPSTNLTNLINSAVNDSWQEVSYWTFRSCGVSGVVSVTGNINYDNGVLARGFADINNNGSLLTVNTTIANTIDLTVQWSAASTSNSIKSTNALLEVLN